MRKLLLSIAALTALGTASAAGASGPVFTIVPETQPMTAFASAEVPNSSLVLPPSWLTPRHSNGLPFPILHGYWQRAGATYGIPWQVLAAINKVESNFGKNMGPSSAGAVGWMQFMPSTWDRWGMDADGDGIADPWNPQDAIFAAARYLAAAGGRTDLPRSIFAYNHAQWYVDEILGLAQALRPERRRRPVHLRPAPGEARGRRAHGREAEPDRRARDPRRAAVRATSTCP